MPGQKAPEQDRRKEILRAAYHVAARQGVEALTVRAVADRAAVSHGTILFHFSRRDALVASLLDSVLDSTTVLRVPDDVAHHSRPADRMRLVLRGEMDRLSNDPRHFRLFLEYWALGVRDTVIRRRVSAALEGYRAAFRVVAQPVAHDEPASAARGSRGPRDLATNAPDVAAVAVSLVHGCALQALIDPPGFSVQQHFDTAVRMLDAFYVDTTKRESVTRAPRKAML